MPAKGQDIMAQSIFLAKLIGPILIALGAGMLVNARDFRPMVEEFLRSQALIFLSGLLSITAGLALVLTHNVWAADWRVIITVLGWLGFIGGIVRIVYPQLTRRIGASVFAQPYTLLVGGAFNLALGAILCFFGYLR
jgi:uncharacterized membrane protein